MVKAIRKLHLPVKGGETHLAIDVLLGPNTGTGIGGRYHDMYTNGNKHRVTFTSRCMSISPFGCCYRGINI